MPNKRSHLDEKPLAIITNKDAYIRRSAVEKISDEDVLSSIAKSEEFLCSCYGC